MSGRTPVPGSALHRLPRCAPTDHARLPLSGLPSGQTQVQQDDDFILVNFANPDMVGHTGVLSAAIKAVETVDDCANQVVQAILDKGGVALVTADHGNCERMIDEVTGNPHTYHSTQPVSFFVIGDQYFNLRPRGALADVAPTVLDLLAIAMPAEMTGRSLID